LERQRGAAFQGGHAGIRAGILGVAQRGCKQSRARQRAVSGRLKIVAAQALLPVFFLTPKR